MLVIQMIIGLRLNISIQINRHGDACIINKRIMYNFIVVNVTHYPVVKTQ